MKVSFLNKYLASLNVRFIFFLFPLREWMNFSLAWFSVQDVYILLPCQGWAKSRAFSMDWNSLVAMLFQLHSFIWSGMQKNLSKTMNYMPFLCLEKEIVQCCTSICKRKGLVELLWLSFSQYWEIWFSAAGK